MGKKRSSTAALFQGLKICVTALNLADRKAVLRATEECGGEYRPDLDQSCTHLLVGEPKGAKFEMAVQWQLKTVSPAWFWDSIEEGLLLPVSRYTITKPTAESPSSVALQSGKPAYFNGMLFAAGQQVKSIYGDKVKEMVQEGGGSYQTQFDAKTTHYIVLRADLETEDEEILLKRSSWRPVLVRVAWLRACNGAKALLPQTGYDVTPPSYAAAELLKQEDATKKRGDAPSRQFLEGIGQLDHTDNIVISKKRRTVDSHHDDADNVVIKKSHIAPSTSTTTAVVVHQQDDPEMIRRSRATLDGLHAFEPVLNSKSSQLGGNAHPTRKSRIFETADVAEASWSAWELIPIDSTTKTSTSCPASAHHHHHSDDLFKGLKFHFVDQFEEQMKAVLISIINFHSGIVVKEWSKKNGPAIDYLVVPWRTRPIFGLNVKVITECWITRSDQEHQRLPLDKYLLLTPLDIAYPLSDFSEYIISVSGYIELDRDWVMMLTSLLGAQFTDRMTKETTHLICASPEGNKFTKATQWKIPIVDIEWLYDSAICGFAVPVATHPVKTKVQQQQQHKPQSRKSVGEVVTAQTQKHHLTDTNDHHHINHTNNINNNKENLITPAPLKTNKNELVVSSIAETNDLPSSITKEEILTNQAVCGTTARKVNPHESALFGLKDSPMESPSALHDTRLRSKRLAAGGTGGPPPPILDQLYDERVLLGAQDRPLDKCRISLSTRAGSRRSEILTLCDQLGAQFLGAYDSSCTHLIHIGTAVETVEPRDYRMAKSNKKFIVHPDWLHKCVDTGRRIPEAQFPHHYHIVKTPDHRKSTERTFTLDLPAQATRKVGRPRKNAPVPAGSDPRNPIFMASQQAPF